MSLPLYLSAAIGDQSTFAPLGFQLVAFTSNADHVLSSTEYAGLAIYVTDSFGLSGSTKKIVYPLLQGSIKVVFNACSVAIAVGGSSGASVTVPAGQGVIVGCLNGTAFTSLGGASSGTAIDTSSVHTAAVTMAVGNAYKFNTNGGAINPQAMPAAPTEGDIVEIVDGYVSGGGAYGSFSVANPITLTTTGGVKILAFGTFAKGTSCVITEPGWFRFRAIVDSTGDTVWSQF